MIHEIAIRQFHEELYWRVDDWRERHPRCPDWIAERIVRDMRRAALRRAARKAVQLAGERGAKHLSRDYRGWNRDGTRDGPGSGRAADWLDIGFEHLSVLARAVYRETGYRDETCRRIARTLHGLRGGWDAYEADDARIAELPPCPVEPTWWDYGYSEEFHRSLVARSTPHVQRWWLWLMWNGQRAIAEHDLAAVLDRLASDPEARIDPYLAASIARWRAGEDGYEGCSGCAYYALVRERPELWDYLWSRAPTGEKRYDEDGNLVWAQVYTHEDHSAYSDAGWYETFTIHGYSVWTRRHPFATVDTPLGDKVEVAN
jgi:hypothetical protein